MDRAVNSGNDKDKIQKPEATFRVNNMPETCVAEISAPASDLSEYKDIGIAPTTARQSRVQDADCQQQQANSVSDELDTALVHRAQQGDTDAMQDLVVKYQKWVYTLCYRVLGNHADADDISQETFIALYRYINKFKPQPNATFAGWLYRITVNLCRNQLRRKKRLREESLDAPIFSNDEHESNTGQIHEVPDNRTNPSKEVLNQELSSLIQSAVNALSEEHRMAFVLHEYQDLSYQEIADAMQCPIGTVMSRLYHAKRELREKLKSYL